ncbi:apolipoprotein B receptor [Tachyglossus aculeatus]|uniref:apolipoprotein B receptor n=1 Tax=Tachyglossus aculeatus TaxID=9261 RepID=UPI0018F6AC80|nr:apolipoprotein B receptor [Tachyglossus aculeatus]
MELLQLHFPALHRALRGAVASLSTFASYLIGDGVPSAKDGEEQPLERNMDEPGELREITSGGGQAAEEKEEEAEDSAPGEAQDRRALEFEDERESEPEELTGIEQARKNWEEEVVRCEDVKETILGCAWEGEGEPKEREQEAEGEIREGRVKEARKVKDAGGAEVERSQEAREDQNVEMVSGEATRTRTWFELELGAEAAAVKESQEVEERELKLEGEVEGEITSRVVWDVGSEGGIWERKEEEVEGNKKAEARKSWEREAVDIEGNQEMGVVEAETGKEVEIEVRNSCEVEEVMEEEEEEACDTLEGEVWKTEVTKAQGPGEQEAERSWETEETMKKVEDVLRGQGRKETEAERSEESGVEDRRVQDRQPDSGITLEKEEIEAAETASGQEIEIVRAWETGEVAIWEERGQKEIGKDWKTQKQRMQEKREVEPVWDKEGSSGGWEIKAEEVKVSQPTMQFKKSWSLEEKTGGEQEEEKETREAQEVEEEIVREAQELQIKGSEGEVGEICAMEAWGGPHITKPEAGKVGEGVREIEEAWKMKEWEPGRELKIKREDSERCEEEAEVEEEKKMEVVEEVKEEEMKEKAEERVEEDGAQKQEAGRDCKVEPEDTQGSKKPENKILEAESIWETERVSFLGAEIEEEKARKTQEEAVMEAEEGQRKETERSQNLEESEDQGIWERKEMEAEVDQKPEGTGWRGQGMQEAGEGLGTEIEAGEEAEGSRKEKANSAEDSRAVEAKELLDMKELEAGRGQDTEKESRRGQNTELEAGEIQEIRGVEEGQGQEEKRGRKVGEENRGDGEVKAARTEGGPLTELETGERPVTEDSVVRSVGVETGTERGQETDTAEARGLKKAGEEEEAGESCDMEKSEPRHSITEKVVGTVEDRAVDDGGHETEEVQTRRGSEVEESEAGEAPEKWETEPRVEQERGVDSERILGIEEKEQNQGSQHATAEAWRRDEIKEVTVSEDQATEDVGGWRPEAGAVCEREEASARGDGEMEEKESIGACDIEEAADQEGYTENTEAIDGQVTKGKTGRGLKSEDEEAGPMEAACGDGDGPEGQDPEAPRTPMDAGNRLPGVDNAGEAQSSWCEGLIPGPLLDLSVPHSRVLLYRSSSKRRSRPSVHHRSSATGETKESLDLQPEEPLPPEPAPPQLEEPSEISSPPSVGTPIPERRRARPPGHGFGLAHPSMMQELQMRLARPKPQ